MKINDLKVGDKVFIREDLEDDKLYGNNVYIDDMRKGIQEIRLVSREHGVIRTVETPYYSYTPEMIDWEKTAKLNNLSCFKKIIQCGECRNEITKATMYDGREITVKNSNEKNDIEKAVMLLMLKSLGVTYRDIEKEVEKVKWEPIAGEQFYYISTTPALKVRAVTYFTDGALKSMADVGNCFKTKKEAEGKLEKIKEVLRGE